MYQARESALFLRQGELRQVAGFAKSVYISKRPCQLQADLIGMASTIGHLMASYWYMRASAHALAIFWHTSSIGGFVFQFFVAAHT